MELPMPSCPAGCAAAGIELGGLPLNKLYHRVSVQPCRRFASSAAFVVSPPLEFGLVAVALITLRPWLWARSRAFRSTICHSYRRYLVAPLLGSLTAATAPSAAHAGPFINFLSDILPVKEAQKEFAKFDFALRDGSNAFLDSVQTRKPRTEVLEAQGAESVVFAAADAAAAAVGIDVNQVNASASELEASESRRLRTRVEIGYFESERVGSTTAHLASRTDSLAFRTYCRWRAYAKGLANVKDSSAAAVAFRAEFGKRLLVELKLPPTPAFRATQKDSEALFASLKVALDAIVAAGLCTKASVEIDDVLVELWTEGTRRDLVVQIWVEGDPLVDAQVLLQEEFAAPLFPDPVLAMVEAWLRQGRGVAWTLEQYYVDAWSRRKSEREAMEHVPKQRLVEVTFLIDLSSVTLAK